MMAAMAPRTIPVAQEAVVDHPQSVLMALEIMVEQAAQAQQMLTEPAPTLLMPVVAVAVPMELVVLVILAVSIR